MNDKDNVLHYYQQFLVLSNPLLKVQRLSTSKCDRAFWSGFHSQDCAEMYVRLIAKYPDQPSGAHFDYMDIYKVARVTFSGTHLRDRELDNPWYGSQGLQSGHSECAQYQRSDQEEYDL